jgi:serine/threonine-protein kinase RsbW
MSNTFSTTILNTVEQLEQLMEHAANFLESAGASKASYAVQLALEEMITNTIKYGYADQGEHRIEVGIELHPASVHLRIKDDAHEFDPLLAPVPDVSQPLEDRPIGGLGIHFVRKMTTSMQYHRNNGNNILEMEFAR